MLDLDPSRQTRYVIMFQGLIRDGWDHAKDEVTGTTPLMKEPCYKILYNAMWVVRIDNLWKNHWVGAKDNPDSPAILPEGEMFISYGERAFCKASLPIAVLVKAVFHYWSKRTLGEAPSGSCVIYHSVPH